MSVLTGSKILTGDAPLDAVAIAPASVTTLPRLFQHQASRYPDSIAFSVQTKGGLESVTYKDADRLATSIAISIAQLSKSTSSNQAPIVAIWLEKGLELILSILSTTYSGATWLPLDPDVPVERAAVCILDASATVIISDDAHADQIRELQDQVNPQLRAADKPALHCRTFTELSIETAEVALY